VIRLRFTRELAGWTSVLVEEIADGRYGFVSRTEVPRLQALAQVLRHHEPETDQPVNILNSEWVYIRRALERIMHEVPAALAYANRLYDLYATEPPLTAAWTTPKTE
jgi:hypothetical protein